MKNSFLGQRLFNVFNIMLFVVISLMTIAPFLNVIALSLEPERLASQTGIIQLFPREITFVAYQEVFKNPMIFSAFWNSIFITVTGAFFGVILTAMMAYGLSESQLPGSRELSFFIVFTMMFHGGIIPHYILIKQLGLLDTLWSLVIPSLMGAYNIMLMKAFFREMPVSLKEAAKIDGCSEIDVFFRIILPLSKPIIATITLFIAVDKWNDFFDAVMFISSTFKKPLQVILREILIQNSNTQTQDITLGMNVQMATVIVATLPILFVYPFLQKHFAKGILLGSIKG